MTEDILWHCETCSKPIREGDRAHFCADGPALCAEHAPMLSDVIRQHQEVADRQPFDPGDLNYDSLEEMLGYIDRMKDDLATNGDRKVVWMS